MPMTMFFYSEKIVFVIDFVVHVDMLKMSFLKACSGFVFSICYEFRLGGYSVGKLLVMWWSSVYCTQQDVYTAQCGAYCFESHLLKQ